jgi:hypothetical protein
MQYSICGSIQEYVWLGGGLMRADDYKPLAYAWRRLWKALDSVDELQPNSIKHSYAEAARPFIVRPSTLRAAL